MKNNITVDIDTDRQVPGPVLIGKPMGFPVPKSAEEFHTTVELDMVSLCEGICTMIHLLEQSGGRKSPESLRVCIDYLQEGFADADYKCKSAIEIQPIGDMPIAEKAEKFSDYVLCLTEKSYCPECGERAFFIGKATPGAPSFFICFKCRFIGEVGVGPVLDVDKSKHEFTSGKDLPVAGEAAENNAPPESADGAAQDP